MRYVKLVIMNSFLRLLKEDLDNAREHDPAARGDVENALVYSGLHAIWIHRATHKMWANPSLRFPARLLSQLGLWQLPWRRGYV